MTIEIVTQKRRKKVKNQMIFLKFENRADVQEFIDTLSQYTNVILRPDNSDLLSPFQQQVLSDLLGDDDDET